MLKTYGERVLFTYLRVCPRWAEFTVKLFQEQRNQKMPFVVLPQHKHRATCRDQCSASIHYLPSLHQVLSSFVPVLFFYGSTISIHSCLSPSNGNLTPPPPENQHKPCPNHLSPPAYFKKSGSCQQLQAKSCRRQAHTLLKLHTLLHTLCRSLPGPSQSSGTSRSHFVS